MTKGHSDSGELDGLGRKVWSYCYVNASRDCSCDTLILWYLMWVLFGLKLGVGGAGEVTLKMKLLRGKVSELPAKYPVNYLGIFGLVNSIWNFILILFLKYSTLLIFIDTLTRISWYHVSRSRSRFIFMGMSRIFVVWNSFCGGGHYPSLPSNCWPSLEHLQFRQDCRDVLRHHPRTRLLHREVSQLLSHAWLATTPSQALVHRCWWRSRWGVCRIELVWMTWWSFWGGGHLTLSDLGNFPLSFATCLGDEIAHCGRLTGQIAAKYSNRNF